MKRVILIGLFLIVFVSATVFATTWFKSQTNCPICKTENEFAEIGSYGGYIYNWPSKFQYIYWPKTDSNVLYSCKDCKLTCFMWDFEKIPEDKFEDIKKALKDVKLAEKENYSDIPMTDRLKVAEKVYKITKPDDKPFWCEFYRVMGYHFEDANDMKNATKAREKALKIAEEMLKDKDKKGFKKENLLIKGAMQYFIGNPDDALKTLKEAKEEEYKNPDFEDDDNEGMNKYFDKLLDEYIKKIDTLAAVKVLIDKVFEQAWFEKIIEANKLKKDENYKVFFPTSILKDGVEAKKPLSIKISKKEVDIRFGTTEDTEKTIIYFTKFVVSDNKAEITVKVGDSEPKELTFTKEKETWTLAEKE